MVMIMNMAKRAPRVNEGAPRKYDRKAVLARLTEYLSTGMSVDKACQEDGMPTPQMIHLWVTEDDELFELYMRAQRAWTVFQAQDIIKIADDQSRDVILDAKGNQRSDNTAVNRDNLRIKTRQYLMSRWFPKVFGEKIEQQVTGKDGAALQVVINVNTKQQKIDGATPKQITHESEE